MPRLVDFGTVVAGRSARQVIEIRDDAPVARSVARVATTDPSQFKASFIPCKSAKHEDEQDAGMLLGHVEIELCKHDAGLLSANLEIFLADRPEPDKVPLLARMAPLVAATPSSVLLPRHSENRELFFVECLVSTNDGSPLKLVLKETSPHFTIRLIRLDCPDKMMVRVDCNGALASPTIDRILLQAYAGNDQAQLEIPVRFERAATNEHLRD